MQTSNPIIRTENTIPKAKVPFFVHLLNPVMKTMLHFGVGMGGDDAPKIVLFTVPGRKTGKQYTTPLGIFEYEGHRYLFGTFGEAKWTRNLRASGQAVLTSKGHRETVASRELGLEERGKVLWNILPRFLNSRMARSFVQMGYGLSADSTMADYEEEAKRHPGFELTTESRLH